MKSRDRIYKERLAEGQNGQCAQCSCDAEPTSDGSPVELVLEHIDPTAPFTISNAALVCRKCIAIREEEVRLQAMNPIRRFMLKRLPQN